MANSESHFHPEPIPEDIAAAKAALQRARPDLATESEEYNMRVQCLARRRAEIGADKFDIMHLLREPRNPMERADLEGLAGIITREQRRAVYLANDPDPKVLSAFFDAWERRLEHLGAMLQAVVRIATDQRRHPLSRRGEGAVDQHVAAIKQKFSLWSEELAQAYRFLTQVRLDLDGKPVTLGKDSGETAHWLAVLVTERATKMWWSCKRTAKRSRTRPEYLHATTAAALFYKSMIEKGDLPRPNDLAALMRLERVAADRALAARSNISPLYANVPSQRMDATTINIAAQGVETIQVTEKGIEFPGTEVPAFKSAMADRMTKVFISYAHSSPEHKLTVSSLVETLREKGLTVTVDTDVKTPQGPEEGWPKWMKRQIREADWVLVLFDKLYRRRFDGDEAPNTGLGATWEGAIITHHFYRDSTKNKKFIPLLADGASTDLIPDELVGYTRYFVPTQAAELAVALCTPNEVTPIPRTPRPECKRASEERKMGEKLVAFVREVLRERELLENAMERDDVAISLMRQDEIGRRNRRQGTGHRRIWTRRDKRLLDAGYENGPGCPRSERILERLRPERGEGPHIPLLRAALDESRREGTFSHLAPIMEDLANAHVDFFNHVAEVAAGQVGGRMQFPYSRVKDAFDNAVNRLMPFLPPDAVQFDEEYPWDGRHESQVLCRDLRQPAVGPEGKYEDRLNPERGNLK